MKSLHIKEVFEKDDDNSYTKNALLYQDIIQYSVKTNIQQFKLQEVGKWLIKNNHEFRSDYSSSPSANKRPMNYKVKLKRDRICNKIEDLLKLNLIYESGRTKAEKVDNIIPLYSLTGEGEFVAWLLERINSKKTQNADEKLFAMIRLFLEEYPSSNTTILLRVYEKSRDQNFFSGLIGEIEILLSNGRFESISDAILWTIFKSNDLELEKNVETVYLELLEELHSNPHLTKMLMYAMKMTQERKIYDQCPPIEWEDLWMKNLHNYDVVVLYGECYSCKSRYPVDVKMDQKFFDAVPEKLTTLNCKECKTSNSLHLYSNIPDRPMRLPKMNK